MDKLFYRPIIGTENLEVRALEVSVSVDQYIGSTEAIHQPIAVSRARWCKLFEKACKDLKDLRSHELPIQFFVFPLYLCLGDIKDLSKQIATLLKTHGLDPSFLRLEIPLIESHKKMMEIVSGFNSVLKNGASFVVSLFALKSIPVVKYFKHFISALKIDFHALKSTPQNHLIKFAHRCGFEVMVDRLECEEDLDRSRVSGSDFSGGNYVGVPLAYDELLHWAKMHQLHFA